MKKKISKEQAVWININDFPPCFFSSSHVVHNQL